MGRGRSSGGWGRKGGSGRKPEGKRKIVNGKKGVVSLERFANGKKRRPGTVVGSTKSESFFMTFSPSFWGHPTFF